MSKQKSTKKYIYDKDEGQLMACGVNSGEYGRFLQGNQSYDDIVCWENDVDGFISWLEDNDFAITFGEKYDDEMLGVDLTPDWYGDYQDGKYQYTDDQAKERKAIYKKVTYAYEDALGADTVEQAIEILQDAGIICADAKPFVIGEHTEDDGKTIYIDGDYPDEAYYGEQDED